jgi:hypothetical protein
MFWMLREAGTSCAEIGRAADLSVERPQSSPAGGRTDDFVDEEMVIK